MSSTLPAEASVIIIGGGIVGASTAYHLVKAGVQDVLLLERNKLTCGTTWHSAAQVRQLRSGENLTRLIRYSAELYARLEADTGQATGWLQTGSLSIATHADRRIHIRRQAVLAQSFGVEAEIIGPRDAAELWPLMRSDDVLEAVWSPGDGRVNPSDLVLALIKGARAGGLTVVEDAPVIGFRTRNGRIATVETTAGSTACKSVVNCAGLWGREVSAFAGVACPLYACEHFYLLTQPVGAGLPHLPTLSDHDGCLYIRDDVGGLLVGCFEPNPKPIGLDELPRDFAFDLLNEDWDHFEPMLENAVHRIPALADAQVRMLLNGPESFTPDGAFLLGESAELPGFYLGCGMNSMGVASAGGAGMALAAWIVDGHPPFELSPVDARRFGSFHASMRALRERIPETLALHYAISFPHREPKTARGLRLSPLHDRHRARGAHFVQRFGWERPAFFCREGELLDETLTFGRPAWLSISAREHHAARDAVALFDQSSFGKLRVKGPDAERLLQRLCANDVAVAPGRCVYTQMLNIRGGIESDLVAMRLAGDDYLLVTGTGQAVRDRAWLERHREKHERAAVIDQTSAFAVLSLAGPRSQALLAAASGDPGAAGSLSRYCHGEIELGCVIARAARLSYSGEDGFELYVPVASALHVYDLLHQEGIAFGLQDAGIHALSSLRIEAGMRAFGHDLTSDDDPYSAGLGFAVKPEKGVDFLGREALLARRDKHSTRRLVSLRVEDGDVYIIGGEPVRLKNGFVGRVTSAAFGHTLGRCVALAWIDSSVFAGTEDGKNAVVDIDTGLDRLAATVFTGRDGF